MSTVPDPLPRYRACRLSIAVRRSPPMTTQWVRAGASGQRHPVEAAGKCRLPRDASLALLAVLLHATSTVVSDGPSSPARVIYNRVPEPSIATPLHGQCIVRPRTTVRPVQKLTRTSLQSVVRVHNQWHVICY